MYEIAFVTDLVWKFNFCLGGGGGPGEIVVPGTENALCVDGGAARGQSVLRVLSVVEPEAGTETKHF